MIYVAYEKEAPFFPTANVMKPTPTLCHCKLPQLTLCHDETTHYCKAFNLTYPSLDKSKFETNPGHLVIIDRFSNRLNVNVIILLIKH